MNENEREKKLEQIEELLEEVVRNGDAALLMINNKVGVVIKGTPRELTASISTPLQSFLLTLGKKNIKTMNNVATAIAVSIIGALTVAHKCAGCSTEEYTKAMTNFEAAIHDNDILLKTCEIAENIKAMNGPKDEDEDKSFFTDLMNKILK